MAKRLLALFLVVALMTIACGGTDFSNVDLESLVYREGDLPTDLGPVGVQAVDQKKDWTYADWAEAQIIAQDDEIVLIVDVILFSDKKELEKAFQDFLTGGIPQSLTVYDPPDIGEKIVGKKLSVSVQSSQIYLVFRRCYSLVTIYAHVFRNSELTEERIYEYAEALDDRLVHSVCPI
jgi:hypothetical protein